MFPPCFNSQELRAAVQKAEEVQLQPNEYPAAWLEKPLGMVLAMVIS